MSRRKKCEFFQKETLDKLTKSNSEIELRRANDVILEFERAFIVDEEIPGTTFNSKNILVSPSITNLYKGLVKNVVLILIRNLKISSLFLFLQSTFFFY